MVIFQPAAVLFLRHLQPSAGSWLFFNRLLSVFVLETSPTLGWYKPPYVRVQTYIRVLTLNDNAAAESKSATRFWRTILTTQKTVEATYDDFYKVCTIGAIRGGASSLFVFGGRGGGGEKSPGKV